MWLNFLAAVILVIVVLALLLVAAHDLYEDGMSGCTGMLLLTVLTATILVSIVWAIDRLFLH